MSMRPTVLWIVLAGSACAHAGPPVAVTPAPASAPTPALDVDPVGAWQFSLQFQGQPIEIMATLQRKPDGSITGQVSGAAIPTSPITKVQVSGQHVTLTVVTPDGGEAHVDFLVDGNTAAGSWSMAGDGSRISGVRLP